MSPVIDARREPNDQVDACHDQDVDQGALSDTSKQAAIMVQKSPLRADQAKNRCRRPQGILWREQKGGHISGKAAQQVQSQVAHVSKSALQLRPQGVQGIHIETNVQQGAGGVQEHGGDQAPKLAL